MCLTAQDYKDLYHIELRKAKYIEFCETKYIEQACLYIDVIIRNAECGIKLRDIFIVWRAFMNIILCIDKNGGMSFCGKRQSQDRVLREKIFEISSAGRLLMNSYSAKQFENNEGIVVDEVFLNNANQGDFCFVEDKEISAENVEAFYVFNWNRKYPADLFFNVDLKAEGFKKIKKEEFQGNSHDKITLEIYSR